MPLLRAGNAAAGRACLSPAGDTTTRPTAAWPAVGRPQRLGARCEWVAVELQNYGQQRSPWRSRRFLTNVQHLTYDSKQKLGGEAPT
ncbi:hypothetical protein MJ579_18145 [Klebsiella pneumoniae]|nr:hypothetical protein MJ579_18145 [Klebsiella pneumoniae]